MRHFFTYNGTNSKEFNVWISGGGTYDAPERDVTKVSVPGRNGDLTMDNGRFENVKMTYPAFIPKDFSSNMAAFRAFMKSMTGYQRLEDTYHPDYYYEALFTEQFDPETTALNRAGEFDITFDRKPQRWLKSGEKTITFGSAGSIFNPTMFTAKPLIRVYGSGVVGIGSVTITIEGNTSYIDVDCDLQDAYRGLVNMNSYLTLNSEIFPTLEPGVNGISVAGVSSIIITPRWWTV